MIHTFSSIFKKMILIAFVMAMASAVGAESRLVRCPDLTAIHHAAGLIDNATYVNSGYIANTPPYAIHTTHLAWFAVVYGIRAGSVSDAILIGREVMQSASSQRSEYARSSGRIYICEYDDGRITVYSDH